MCIYHYACKFETQIFKNHHKLMSLEMQSHFPSSPAKESEGSADKTSKKGRQEGEMDRGRSSPGGWPQTQVLACPTGLGSDHQLPSPVLQAYQPVTTSEPCLCQDPRAPRLLSFFHIMQTSWLCTAVFATSPASTSVLSRQVF